MTWYHVKWTIELEANSPKDAAEQALHSITDGIARVFAVSETKGPLQPPEKGTSVLIDLDGEIDE